MPKWHLDVYAGNAIKRLKFEADDLFFVDECTTVSFKLTKHVVVKWIANYNFLIAWNGMQRILRVIYDETSQNDGGRFFKSIQQIVVTAQIPVNSHNDWGEDGIYSLMISIQSRLEEAYVRSRSGENLQLIPWSSDPHRECCLPSGSIGTVCGQKSDSSLTKSWGGIREEYR